MFLGYTSQISELITVDSLVLFASIMVGITALVRILQDREIIEISLDEDEEEERAQDLERLGSGVFYVGTIVVYLILIVYPITNFIYQQSFFMLGIVIFSALIGTLSFLFYLYSGRYIGVIALILSAIAYVHVVF